MLSVSKGPGPPPSFHPGYWPSQWPDQCGGSQRQKASAGRLEADSGTATVTTSRIGRWNVMVVVRAPGSSGTSAVRWPSFRGPDPFGVRSSGSTQTPWSRRPHPPSCGAAQHVWCGAILAHGNGSIHQPSTAHTSTASTPTTSRWSPSAGSPSTGATVVLLALARWHPRSPRICGSKFGWVHHGHPPRPRHPGTHPRAPRAARGLDGADRRRRSGVTVSSASMCRGPSICGG